MINTCGPVLWAAGIFCGNNKMKTQINQEPTPVLPQINFGTDPLPDFHHYIEQLRGEGHSVVPVRYINDIAWLLIDYIDVRNAYADEEHMPSAAAYKRHSVPSQGITLQAMEGEEHRINRALVSPVFRPEQIRERVATQLSPIANQLIDGFGDARTIDLVPAFTRAFPYKVISEMVGIPENLQHEFVDKVYIMFRYPWEPEAAVQAKEEITAALLPLIAERRANPCADLLSNLAMAEFEGRSLSDEEICSFIRLLYPAGAETSYLTMGSLIWEILSDRKIYDELMAHPDKRSDAVEEALRKHGAVNLQPRYTEQDITINGVTIPANSWVLFGNGPSSYDPSVFPEPETFSLDRRPNPHLAFGKGLHFCLGSHLAREELRLSVNILLDRLPGLRLTEEVSPAGTVLRGVVSLPVAFDDILPPIDYVAEKKSIVRLTDGKADS